MFPSSDCLNLHQIAQLKTNYLLHFRWYAKLPEQYGSSWRSTRTWFSLNQPTLRHHAYQAVPVWHAIWVSTCAKVWSQIRATEVGPWLYVNSMLSFPFYLFRYEPEKRAPCGKSVFFVNGNWQLLDCNVDLLVLDLLLASPKKQLCSGRAGFSDTTSYCFWSILSICG